MKKLKVVIDTSVVVSAILGSPHAPLSKVLRALLEKKFESYSSDKAIEELQHVLFSDKIVKYFNNYFDFLAWSFLIISSAMKRVNPNTKLNICRDPYDNIFLEVTYEVKAEYLVTLDYNLLELRDHSKEVTIFEHKLKILRPEEFLQELENITNK